jgi:hypothetical protein
MLLKCHYYLHPLAESERDSVDQGVEKDNYLVIFEMIVVNTSELTTKLNNRKLFIFMHYQMDVKDIKCPLQWWEKHENMFPIGFCVKQILRIIESKIEMNKVFSLIRILAGFRRCLQSKHLDKMIFVNKNWPNDPKLGCKF